MNKTLKGAIIGVVFVFLALFVVRLISPTEIDDIHPNIPCNELLELNPDILWVIPSYEGNSISSDENEEWCEKIVFLNKELGMHGINHSYWEFRRKTISQEELDKAISEFEGCFGYAPEMFKAPQLRINEQNKELIKENNLLLRGRGNQIFHKVYHCNDSGRIPNWAVKIF